MDWLAKVPTTIEKAKMFCTKRGKHPCLSKYKSECCKWISGKKAWDEDL